MKTNRGMLAGEPNALREVKSNHRAAFTPPVPPVVRLRPASITGQTVGVISSPGAQPVPPQVTIARPAQPNLWDAVDNLMKNTVTLPPLNPQAAPTAAASGDLYSVSYYRKGDPANGGELYGVYDNEADAKKAAEKVRQWAATIKDPDWKITKVEIDKMGSGGKGATSTADPKGSSTTRSAGASKAAIKDTIDASGGKYNEKGGQTHCSEWVADLAAKMTGKILPELADTKGQFYQANQQYQNLMKSNQFYRLTDFQPTKGGKPPADWKQRMQTAFTTAQRLANSGNVVIVTWSGETAGKSGHVAIVSPTPQDKDELYPSGGSWEKLKTPYMANAGPTLTKKNQGLPKNYLGTSVNADLPLPYAFGGAKKYEVQIFVLKPEASSVVTEQSPE